MFFCQRENGGRSVEKSEQNGLRNRIVGGSEKNSGREWVARLGSIGSAISLGGDEPLPTPRTDNALWNRKNFGNEIRIAKLGSIGDMASLGGHKALPYRGIGGMASKSFHTIFIEKY